MRVVIQRVLSAAVAVNGECVGSIAAGLLVFAGIARDDTPALCPVLAKKISHMRIFENAGGKFDKSLLDIGGGVLLIPQFTLFADATKGRRPEFFQAAPPSLAIDLFASLVAEFKKLAITPVATGVFGAHMLVSSANDGPVTIPLELSSTVVTG